MLDRFVTFEGGEGAGKTTQVSRLATSLRDKGHTVVVTREPGGSPLAERIRAFLLSPERPALEPKDEALLFAAARSDHLSKVIRPALSSGAIVICDRFADSTLAYQGSSVARDLLDELYHESVGDDGPCLTVLLDVPAGLGLQRAGTRRGVARVDRFESEGPAFHAGLRKKFLSLADAEPKRFVVLDGRMDIEVLGSVLLDLVERRLGLVPGDDAVRAA